jgi:predicted ATPase
VLDGLDGPEATAAAGGLLPPLLRQAPGLTILVTSRARLSLPGQTRIDVRGLPLPARPEDLDTSPAGACLLRAARAQGAPPPAAADRAAAVAICRAVDGLPLALELAAGCLRGMPYAALAAELHQGTAALDLLAAPGAGGAGGVQSGRGVRPLLEDAWARLSEAERTVLRDLAPFCGAFTRAAAGDVAGATAAQLVALVDAGVLLRTDAGSAGAPAGTGAAGRYLLPALVRAFAGERLSERPEEARRVRRREASYRRRQQPAATAPARAAPARTWEPEPDPVALAVGSLRGRPPAPVLPRSGAVPAAPLSPVVVTPGVWRQPAAPPLPPPVRAGARPRAPPGGHLDDPDGRTGAPAD